MRRASDRTGTKHPGLLFLLPLFSLTILWPYLEGYAQSPTATAPTGCRTSTIKNTLFFERARPAHPNDTNIVLGAFTVTDDDVPEDSANRPVNCHSAGPSDHYPTHVTLLAVTVISGDLAKSDVVQLKLVNDANGDGFFQEIQDRPIGPPSTGNCLFSSCVFSLERTQSLFTVDANAPKTFLILADIGPKLTSDANLKIRVKAEANNIGTDNSLSISSDFNEAYRTQISNITMQAAKADGCAPGTCSPYFPGRGSGAPETLFRALQTADFLTRYRETQIKPGTREVIAALLYVCEGGTPLTEKIKIQPVATDISHLQDYPNILLCKTSLQPDALGTRVLRVLVKAQGNVDAIGKLYLYDDSNDNGTLFERGELVWRTNLGEDDTAVFGATERPLFAESRPNASPKAGHYAPQTNPPTLCTPNVPEGASVGCPHLIAITFDVKENADPGQIILDINLDVGNLPGEEENSRTASSNLITGSPLRTQTIVSGSTPQENLRLIKKVAEQTGDPLKIDDGDIVYALGQWTRGQPIDGMTVTDNDMMILLNWWKREMRLAAATETFSAQLQRLGNELTFIISDRNVLSSIVTVYDLNGRIIFREMTSRDRIVFKDFTQLPNGVYLWSISARTLGEKALLTQVRKFALIR